MIGKVIVMPELMKRKRYSTKKEKNEKEEITTMKSKLVWHKGDFFNTNNLYRINATFSR